MVKKKEGKMRDRETTDFKSKQEKFDEL
jgi:hypothetical protein